MNKVFAHSSKKTDYTDITDDEFNIPRKTEKLGNQIPVNQVTNRNEALYDL